jgi:hypothetical protein
MMPSLLRTASANYELEAHQRPWTCRDRTDVHYMNALFRVHWRRIVLDESHLMKNNSSTVFQVRGKTRTRLQPLLVFPLPPHQIGARLPLAA